MSRKMRVKTLHDLVIDDVDTPRLKIAARRRPTRGLKQPRNLFVAYRGIQEVSDGGACSNSVGNVQIVLLYPTKPKVRLMLRLAPFEN